MKRWLVGIVATVMIVGTALVAAAAQGGDDPAPSGSGSTAPRARGAGKGLLFLHADGTAMKPDRSTVEVRVQKGIIQAVDADSITVKSADGYTQTYKIDADTKVKEKGEKSSVSDLKAGEMARVLAVKVGTGYVARRINCVGEPGRRLRAAFGGDAGTAA